MKKILLTTMAIGCGVAAFGQGGVVLENGNNSSAHWNLYPNGPPAPVGNTSAALFWYNGTSFVAVGTVINITAANGGGTFGGPNGGMYWTSTVVQSIPVYQPTGTFEVAGWTGGYASYAAAVVAGAYVGETASFTAGEANLGITPAGTPHGLADGPTSGNPNGTWNGDLVFVPEPSTIALGGLGAAALWLFRRRK